MLRWGKRDTTASMSPDEGEKVFCFVGFFSQANEAVKSLFSVGGNQKHRDHFPPKEQEQLMQTADEGKRSTVKTKRLKALWWFKKQTNSKTSFSMAAIWEENSLLGISCEFEYVTVVTPLSGREVKKWYNDIWHSYTVYEKSVSIASIACAVT